MKTRSKFSITGIRDFLSDLTKRLFGEKILPTALEAGRPNSDPWIVFIPGTMGVVMVPVQAKPDNVKDDPLGCD
jgi:hypothetical protein